MNTFSVDAMHPSAEHLTDDQLDDLLIGDAAPELAAHLTACSSCASRLAELEAPIANFNAVTLAWSERRSATLPAHITAPHRVGMSWLPAAGLTAAAVLVAAVAVPVVRHQNTVHRTAATASNNAPSTVSVTPQSKAVTPAAANTENANASSGYAPDPAEVASDNQLLAAIDQALAAPVKIPAGFDPDAPKSAPGHRVHAPVAPATVQD